MKELITINTEKLNKADIQAEAQLYAEEMARGEINPLDVHIKIKAIEEFLKELKAQPKYMDAVKAEVEKYDLKNPGDCQRYGVGFTIRHAPVRLDYSADDEWHDLKGREEAAASERRARENILKDAYNRGMKFNPNSGEVYAVEKAGGGGEIVVITIPKA